MEVLKEYVWETDERELYELMDSGYQEMYSDVSLSVIYEELSSYYSDDMDHWIEIMFGYYGPFVLLQVDGMYHWMMQS